MFTDIKMLISLLFLHVGDWLLQFSDVWQVLELDPSLLYPSLHVKVPTVPEGYLPPSADWL